MQLGIRGVLILSKPIIDVNGIIREMTDEEYSSYLQKCKEEEERSRHLPPTLEERTSAMEEAILGLMSGLL